MLPPWCISAIVFLCCLVIGGASMILISMVGGWMAWVVMVAIIVVALAGLVYFTARDAFFRTLFLAACVSGDTDAVVRMLRKAGGGGGGAASIINQQFTRADYANVAWAVPDELARFGQRHAYTSLSVLAAVAVCRHRRLLRILLLHGADLSTTTSSWGLTGLHYVMDDLRKHSTDLALSESKHLQGHARRQRHRHHQQRQQEYFHLKMLLAVASLHVPIHRGFLLDPLSVLELQKQHMHRGLARWMQGLHAELHHIVTAGAAHLASCGAGDDGGGDDAGASMRRMWCCSRRRNLHSLPLDPVVLAEAGGCGEPREALVGPASLGSMSREYLRLPHEVQLLVSGMLTRQWCMQILDPDADSRAEVVRYITRHEQIGERMTFYADAARGSAVLPHIFKLGLAKEMRQYVARAEVKFPTEKMIDRWARIKLK